MLWVLGLCMVLAAIDAQREEVVMIAEGSVRGSKMLTYHSREIRAYRGIPYAEPPTGRLRFKPPQRKSPWNGILDASAEGSICPQMVLSTEQYAGDEDCLFLNVYTRRNAVRDPVIMWIHDGGFIEGHGGIELAGPQYLLEHDIVLVTFNYRLGPLGFLSTGDSALPGNYGLKDAVEVLRWIQRNIEAFGGNCDLVTVFGYNSGAACAHSLMMSPLTEGLFHRVIFESGSAVHHWAFKTSPITHTQKVAELVGCISNSSDDIATCLAETSADKLVQTLYSFPHWGVNYPLPYGIVKEVQNNSSDPPFLTDCPLQLIRKGKVHKVPAITGVTATECLILPYLITQSDILPTELSEHFECIALSNFMNSNISYAVVDKVKKFYFGGTSIKKDHFNQLVELFSDTTYNYDTYQAALAQARVTGMPVYVYLFAFEGRLSVVANNNMSLTPLGVNHLDDLFFVFGRGTVFPEGPNKEESATIMRVTKILSDFALTGNPTPEINELIAVKWLPVTKDATFRYLEINKDLTMHVGPFFEKRMDFWDSLPVTRPLDVRE